MKIPFNHDTDFHNNDIKVVHADVEKFVGVYLEYAGNADVVEEEFDYDFDAFFGCKEHTKYTKVKELIVPITIDNLQATLKVESSDAIPEFKDMEGHTYMIQGIEHPTKKPLTFILKRTS